MEPEFNLLCRIVVGFLPFPVMHRAFSRLHQQRISALYLDGFYAAIGEHDSFQFHRPAKVHAARNRWITGNNSVDHLAVACGLIVLRNRRPELETEKDER